MATNCQPRGEHVEVNIIETSTVRRNMVDKGTIIKSQDGLRDIFPTIVQGRMEE